jgi:cysteine desulfurase / selenocysteine lyase
MQVDLLAFPGHKSLLGPTGTGALYVGERCPAPAETGGNGLRPWREGGTGGDSASATQPTLYPYFLEGGTPNTVGIAGLGAGIDYLLELGSSAVLDGERRIVQTIANRLRDDERFVVHGPRKAERRVATLSIGIAGSEAEDVAAILDDSFDIAVRAGLHCAPYCHRRLGTFPSGTVRISVGPFNTDEDLAALLHALDQVAAA